MLKNWILRLTSKGKLLKNIKNDNYKNWETHFEYFNEINGKKANPKNFRNLGLTIYEEHLKEYISDYSVTDDEKQDLAKIRNYFVLTDTDTNRIKAKYAKSAITSLSKQKLSDNKLSVDELDEIESLAKELNLSEEEVNRINQRNSIELYESALKNVVSDNMVTLEEQKQLKTLAKQLGINPDEVSVDKKLSETYKYLVLLNALDQGYLPQVESPSVVMQRNEVAYLEVSAKLQLNKVVTTGYTGGSRGVSVRVMKGVTYRVGASRSTPIKEQVTTRHKGVLVITSKRVLFASSEKPFAIPFTQLISFEPYTDGIGLQKNNKDFLLEFNNTMLSEVVSKVLDNALNKNI